MKFKLSHITHSLLEVIKRPASKGGLISELDGLRWVAIFLVIAQHLSERLLRNLSESFETSVVAQWASRGTTGVFLFFMISGFVLAIPFLKATLPGGKKVSLSKFYMRRVKRIEPPYIFWMIVFFGVLIIQNPNTFFELLPHLGTSLVYLHGFIYQAYSPINPVAWSLEIEVQFYLLAPFLCAAYFSIKHTNWRRAAFLTATSLFLWVQYQAGWLHSPFKMTLLGQLQYFLVGIFLADWYHTHQEKAQSKRTYVWDLIGVVSLLIGMQLWSEDSWKVTGFTVALALLMVSAFKGKLLNHVITNPWIAAFGGMCYTIYLIHLPLLEAYVRVFPVFHFNSYALTLTVQLMAVLPLILVVSTVAYLLVERPFMNGKKNIIKQDFKAFINKQKHHHGMEKIRIDAHVGEHHSGRKSTVF